MRIKSKLEDYATCKTSQEVEQMHKRNQLAITKWGYKLQAIVWLIGGSVITYLILT
jgi:hypothetical protein|tara:strand:+ start:5359 stop:5526 length:168 start_codon:yes stop_codon:yes gene_type:complete